MLFGVRYSVQKEFCCCCENYQEVYLFGVVGSFGGVLDGVDFGDVVYVDGSQDSSDFGGVDFDDFGYGVF